MNKIGGEIKMKRLIKAKVEKDHYEWSKEKMDGFCECAGCGKKIEGTQPYDNYGGEFYCKDCYNEIKDKTLELTYAKLIEAE